MFRDEVVLETLEMLVLAEMLVVEEAETLETVATPVAAVAEVEHTLTLVSGEGNLANQLLLVEMVAVVVLQFGEILEEMVIQMLLPIQTAVAVVALEGLELPQPLQVEVMEGLEQHHPLQDLL
jgi:hypothetical protein